MGRGFNYTQVHIRKWGAKGYPWIIICKCCQFNGLTNIETLTKTHGGGVVNNAIGHRTFEAAIATADKHVRDFHSAS